MSQGYPCTSSSPSRAARGKFSRFRGAQTAPQTPSMSPFPPVTAVPPRQGADGELLSVPELVLACDEAGGEQARITADLPGYHNGLDRALHVEAHREWVEQQQSPAAPQTYRAHGGKGASHPLDADYSDSDVSGFASRCNGETGSCGCVHNEPLTGWCTCKACGGCFFLADVSIQTHQAACSRCSNPKINSSADDAAKPAAAATPPALAYDTPLPGWCTCGACGICFSLGAHGSEAESIRAHFSCCTFEAAIDRDPKCSSRIQARHPHARGPRFLGALKPIANASLIHIVGTHAPIHSVRGGSCPLWRCGVGRGPPHNIGHSAPPPD